MFVNHINITMKKIIFLYLFLAISISSFAQNYYLGKSGDGIEELYILSVTSNMTTRSVVVFDRIAPAQGKLREFRHKIIKNADKKTNTKKFDKLGYYRRKVQFSCRAKKYRIMEATYYEIGGKVLDKVEYDEEKTPWRKLPKGSLTEAECIKACRASR